MNQLNQIKLVRAKNEKKEWKKGKINVFYSVING